MSHSFHPNMFPYKEERPLAAFFPPTHEQVRTSPSEFWRCVGGDASKKKPSSFCAFSADLEEASPKLLNDVQPHHLLIINESSIPENGFYSINIWMGGNNASVNAHFDMNHNHFTQIIGRKRFILLHPKFSQDLHLFPHLHPSDFFSQIDFGQSFSTLLSNWPKFMELEMWEVIVEAGDTLYIPPFWFHYVQALELSVSVNVWSYSLEETASRQTTLYLTQLFLLKQDSSFGMMTDQAAERLQIFLRPFICLVLTKNQMKCQESLVHQFIQDFVYQGSYHPLHMDPNPFYKCPISDDDSNENNIWNKKEQEEEIVKAASLLTTVASLEVRQTILSRVIQLVAFAVLSDPTKVISFLTQCVVGSV
eukprot:Lithocolla_globosa_v1_NODE_1266_length_2718_cov_8.714608.p1 type:complete len:364 gc:universal NODE_1266_length_2718_cov_8.714608:1891-800(-)